MRTIWNKKRLSQVIAIHDYSVKRLHQSRNSLTNERMISFWKGVKMKTQEYTIPYYRNTVSQHDFYCVHL